MLRQCVALLNPDIRFQAAIFWFWEFSGQPIVEGTLSTRWRREGGLWGHLSQFPWHSLNQLLEKVAAAIKLGRLVAHLEIGHYKGIGRSRIGVGRLSPRSMMSSLTFRMRNCVIHKCELSWHEISLSANFANWPFYESKFCLIIVILFTFCPVGVVLKEICA